MTPVISPWVFYLMSVADEIGVIAWIVFIIVGFVGICFGASALIEHSGYSESNDYKVLKAVAKPLIWAAILAIAITVFLPGSRTITKMLVAQNVTYERVEAAGDVVQEVYEDIMELFEDEEE